MEDEVKDLLEDLDLQTLIHADLRENRPDDSFAITEAADKIKDLEAQVARLLGQEEPAVAPRTPPVSRVDTPGTPAPAATPDVSRHSSSAARGQHRPFYNLTASPLRPTSQDRGADPLSGPHWPSSAPSPFAAVSNRPGLPPIDPFTAPRKRPRQDSFGSLAPAQTSKRAVLDNSRSRMAKIDESMETQLVQNHQIYEDLLGDENVQFMVNTENMSEEQAREKILKDREESEREIRQQFQLEKDGELARLLQAQQYESSEDERDFDRRPAPSQLGHLTSPSTFNPGRTLPPPMYNLPDRTHLGGPSNGFSNLGELMNRTDRNRFDFSSNPPLPMQSRGEAGLLSPTDDFGAPIPTPWRTPYIPTNNFDDDLQEISPDYFHSRVGDLLRFGPPAMPGRHLPWMHEPDPRVRDIYMRDPYMRDPNAVGKALELVRDQVDIDMDDEDLVYGFFPSPPPQKLSLFIHTCLDRMLTLIIAADMRKRTSPKTSRT